jgi:hypothetical protein
MGDLTEMRAAAAARFAQAEREASVLDRIAVFGDDMDSLGVSFEVLRLDTAQIEISVVIGGLGDPAVHQACAPVIAAPAPEVEDEEPSSEQVPAVADVAPVAEKPKKAARKYVTGPWSDVETATALDGIKAGRTNGEIAAKLGRHAGSCNMPLAKLRGEIEGTAAPRKRKLVPGKERAKKAPADKAPEAKPKAAKPAPAVQAKAEKPAASVPFAERAGVASLATRAAPDAPAAPVSGIKGERPYAERVIVAHLNAVGYADGWNAERDFELVEEICRGSNLAVVATELQIGFAEAQKRWRLLNTAISDVDHQARLVRILKERVDA